MKKTTKKEFKSKLFQYGVMTSALLASASEVSGQVIYTDIPDETLNSGDFLAIDINQDATGDYTFSASDMFSLSTLFTANSSYAADYLILNSNSFAGVPSYSFGYPPSNLNFGDTISANLNFISEKAGDLNNDSCYFPGSQFCDGNDGYVGLRFKIGTQNHYGWVRIQVSTDGSIITVKDFAYNTTPDEGIEAGQTTLSTKDFESLKLKHFMSDNILNISANNKIDNVQIYNLNGQLLSETQPSNNSARINVNNLSKGVYLAKVRIEGLTKSIKFVK